MKELIEKVAELYAAFEKDAKAQAENGNKAAGTRARKASLFFFFRIWFSRYNISNFCIFLLFGY